MPKPDVTPEIIGEFDRRSTLRIVVGLFAFLMIANVSAYVLLEVHPINRGNWLVREKWKLLDRSSPVETLVLGDSSCNQGVRPDLIDAGLATKSLNLCTIVNVLVVNDAWMLSEYIAKHGPPKRVIIVHVYDAWARERDYAFIRLVGKIPRPLGFWSDYDPALELGVSDLEDIVSSRWLPLHSENVSLWSWIAAPRSTLNTEFAIDERGFMTVTEPAPLRVAATSRKLGDELAGLAPVPSELNRQALRRLDALARQHAIEVTIAPSPMVDELWAQPRMQEHFTKLRAAIVQALGPDSPVRVLAGPPRTFTANQMETADHVVGDAVREYTEWLVAQVRAARR